MLLSRYGQVCMCWTCALCLPLTTPWNLETTYWSVSQGHTLSFWDSGVQMGGLTSVLTCSLGQQKAVDVARRVPGLACRGARLYPVRRKGVYAKAQAARLARLARLPEYLDGLYPAMAPGKAFRYCGTRGQASLATVDTVDLPVSLCCRLCTFTPRVPSGRTWCVIAAHNVSAATVFPGCHEASHLDDRRHTMFGRQRPHSLGSFFFFFSSSNHKPYIVRL